LRERERISLACARQAREVFRLLRASAALGDSWQSARFARHAVAVLLSRMDDVCDLHVLGGIVKVAAPGCRV